MLERLDDTDWAALDHAYGPADDVPALLRALLSADNEARRRAWQTLYGNVIHQGTVWEVTPHVVPFLIEMLEGDAPEPACVLRYLAALAESTGDDGEDDSFYEDAPELARHRGAPARTREAVRHGLHVYRAYTRSPDAECRTEAANLVGLLGAETADELVQRYLAETDEVARAATLWSLRIAIPAASEGGIPDPLSSPSALVRLVEALSMIRCEPSERALEVIAGVLGDPGSVPRYSELPIARFRIELDIAQHIRAAPPFAPGAVLPALIATMHRFSGPAPFVAARIADAVLHLVFGPVEPARLDPSRVEIRAVSELNVDGHQELGKSDRAPNF